ncbi:hypothetical protein BCR33DRAFT_728255 [Rhizoclosmatium globosum]|uniref:Uncharacterized protein n=1 Tax=Rhizoclosmatium globosum TaxID=329046 RepID=A0A1Y2AKP2_9FUNG|nr:hypothetical protein BCR33DRAFT_728255 [Rhizoclosmatium globosum]|eukprot:ORY23076.1 hypothetical protein BCR33DRAFT_728255 [Rhizoclosmatium globosum]
MRDWGKGRNGDLDERTMLMKRIWPAHTNKTDLKRFYHNFTILSCATPTKRAFKYLILEQDDFCAT